MTVKIFLTGATGYIGGDALYELTQAHPEWDYSLLIRTQDKADKVQAQYPDARIVLGSLDDSELLKDEAAKADIVLHTADASDHEGAARAIAAGLVAGHTEARPGYWLHTGGTGILTYFDSRDERLGEWTEDEFDDWAGVGALTSLPDEAFHRHVDKVVLECGTAHATVARTALVCPPTIYGTGRGPVATRSRQAYELARLVLRTGAAPIVGAGRARWRHVHVADLSAGFCRLAETAAAGGGGGADRDELWGARGYYLVESGEHVWAEVARAAARAAHALGFIEAPDREAPLGRQAALDVAGFEAVSWGLNARGRGERLRHLLGWAPHRPSLEASLPEILRYEKARLA